MVQPATPHVRSLRLLRASKPGCHRYEHRRRLGGLRGAASRAEDPPGRHGPLPVASDFTELMTEEDPMQRQQHEPGAPVAAARFAEVIRLDTVTKAYQGSVTKAFAEGGSPALAEVSLKRTGTPAGITSLLTLATRCLG